MGNVGLVHAMSRPQAARRKKPMLVGNAKLGNVWVPTEGHLANVGLSEVPKFWCWILQRVGLPDLMTMFIKTEKLD